MRHKGHFRGLVAVCLLSCGGAQAPRPEPPPSCPECPKPPAQLAAELKQPPTVDDAREFVARVDRELRKFWVARERSRWVSETFITSDTEAMTAAANEATSEYIGEVISESRRYKDLALPEDVARQMMLLRFAQVLPAPRQSKERKELSEIDAWMMGAYGRGKYCPKRLNGKCLTLDELSETMAKSRNYDELLDAWTGWHSMAPPLREKFARVVELGNVGARDIGFADLGEFWRANYDMSPADLEVELERLWQELRPIYEELHCYVRARLREKYGHAKVPDHAPIPAHLLGNMWAQEWNNIYDLVEPYPGVASLDVGKKLVQKQIDARKMVGIGEGFFVSLGMPKLPATFWDRSLFTRPRDRDVVCHPSAWDVQFSGDVRIKMCIRPTEEDLVTIHHELGHDYYYLHYFNLPVLFQAGANDGFQEAVGDTIALSATPEYLKNVGLLDKVPAGDKSLLNAQMKSALEKLAFLPFAYMLDKWRWDIASGKVPPTKYNEAFWALRAKYQGVAPPIARTEADFDAGAKYHVASNIPYTRYFLARIYQFQFHRALCKAGHVDGPLEKCSIYGNREAGKRLSSMLALGASKPWTEALATLSPGESRADASALLQYFAPLRAWLKEKNKKETCGW